MFFELERIMTLKIYQANVVTNEKWNWELISDWYEFMLEGKNKSHASEV